MNLKEIRTAKKLTMQEVSAGVEITESYYSLIENNKRRPSVDVAKRLARYFGFDWTLFFDGESA